TSSEEPPLSIFNSSGTSPSSEALAISRQGFLKQARDGSENLAAFIAKLMLASGQEGSSWSASIDNSHREASMETNVFVALLLASTLTAGAAAAQPAAFNEIGLTMGHWHIVSKDGEAKKKLFPARGGSD